jgi:hypothetical protein
MPGERKVLLLSRARHSHTERGTTYVEVVRGQAPRVTAAQEALFKRFTQSSHRVAALAQEEARHLKHNHIGMKQR